MAKNNVKLIDPTLLIQAGINPKTGLPYRMGSSEDTTKEDLKKILRLIDEQDAVNRYTWYNLPGSITSQDLERMIYYKGQLAFFYLEDLEEFYFMPYALDGTIDFYGRFNQIHPVPMTAGNTDKNSKAQADYLSDKKFKCVYGVVSPEDITYETLTKSAVLIHDYTKQLSQTLVPRQIINDPLLDVMAEIIPYLRTSLLSGTGIMGVRVNDADQEQSVADASASLKDAALKSKPWIPILGPVEMQELTNGSLVKAQDYMMSMQSLDNFRLSTYGLENGGLFEKKAHILQSENDINQVNIGLVMQDGLSIRQNFCNIVNSIWGLGIWCEPSQSHLGVDITGDSLAYDNNADGSMSSINTMEESNGNDDTTI